MEIRCDFKFKNQDREGWDSVQWLDITDRKSFELHLIFFRAFHCVDEDCGPALVPQAVRRDSGRPARRHLGNSGQELTIRKNNLQMKSLNMLLSLRFRNEV